MPDRIGTGRAGNLLAGMGSAGAVVLVAGTFLPWIRSGSTSRNSYQAAGHVERWELLGDGLSAPLIVLWMGVRRDATR